MRATDGIFRSFSTCARPQGLACRRRSSSVRSFSSRRHCGVFVVMRRATGALSDAVGHAAAHRNGDRHVPVGNRRPRVHQAKRTSISGCRSHDAARRHRLLVPGRSHRRLAGLAASDWLRRDLATRAADMTARRHRDAGLRPPSTSTQIEESTNTSSNNSRASAPPTARKQSAANSSPSSPPASARRRSTSAFCPPFELLPQVEANIADDFDATVKVAQVLHNGAQLEVRLSEPAEEATGAFPLSSSPAKAV